MMTLWLYLKVGLDWSALKTLKKSQIPIRRPWKTKLWKLELRRLKKTYDFKRAGVGILFPVIHMYRANGEWWLSGDCSPSVALQMNEDANGRRAKLKPLVILSTPSRLWCRTLSLSTSRTQPLCLSIPLACITSASIHIFIQTNTWLSMLRWANDSRQMCPPPRIHGDKLLHLKYTEEAIGVKKRSTPNLYENGSPENRASRGSFALAVNVNFMSGSFSIHPWRLWLLHPFAWEWLKMNTLTHGRPRIQRWVADNHTIKPYRLWKLSTVVT